MASYSLYVNKLIDWEEYHGMNGRDVASSAYIVVCGGGNTMTLAVMSMIKGTTNKLEYI